MKTSKSFKIHLYDDATGLIKVSNNNWDGLIYKIPRDQLKAASEFEELKQNGIYFLFEDNKVYIGKAERRVSGDGLLERILEHTKDKYKDDWYEAVAFTSKASNSLNLAEISFLENYFYERAKMIQRYKLLNRNTPTQGTVCEDDLCDISERIRYIETILTILGYNLFQPKGITDSSVTESTRTIPPLPSNISLKIGAFVYQSLENLSKSGYSFTEEEIDKMCTSEWTKETFNFKYPFMKRVQSELLDNKWIDGRIRFLTKPFTFGTTTVLISKEWHSNNKEAFVKWYSTLK